MAKEIRIGKGDWQSSEDLAKTLEANKAARGGRLRIIEHDCTWLVSVRTNGEWKLMHDYQTRDEAIAKAQPYLANGNDVNVEQSIG